MDRPLATGIHLPMELEIKRVADITELLERWRDGDQGALHQLAPLVQNKLQAIAGFYLRKERDNHSFSSADLVNEAYLHFCSANPDLVDRKHFFAFAAKVMRRCLLDYAIYKRAEKRKGELHKVVTENLDKFADDHAQLEISNLDEALEALKAWDERKALAIELRYFVGLTAAQIAEILLVSEPTVKRDFVLGRAWMNQYLTSENP